MRHYIIGLMALATMTSAAGCADYGPVPGGSLDPNAGWPAGAELSIVTASLTGRVVAPPNMRPIAGSPEAGALTPDHWTIATSPSSQPERLIADAEVFLADAAGQVVPNIPAVKSDAWGRFTFERLPAAFTFQVVAAFKTAQGEDVRLAAIAQTDVSDTAVDIDGASTLVTAALTENRSGALHDLDLGPMAAMLAATRRRLTPENGPDWADRSAVLQRMHALVSEAGELGIGFNQLRQGLDRAQFSNRERDVYLQGLLRDLASEPR